MDISQIWPEWREECVLGEGSFGKVYRARREERGHTFYSAVKVITVPKTQQEIKDVRAQGMNDAEIYNYFQSLVDNLVNEITLMENLKGAKNIVGIDDYRIIEHEGEIGWDIFIRMELLTSFGNFISNPMFSQKDVIRLGIDICTALETCEQNNIIHRDIKPDNIFVSRFGEYKLGDFGIARKLETTQANLSRKGTLNYMAPEVYKGQEYGTSVDIYSLGLVLYTLLNNNRVAFLPPYPQQITYSDNESALTKRLSGEPLPPPCNASASLGAAILKACAYDPNQRYSNAMEFKNALIAEWNTLIQSGDNKGINPDPVIYGMQPDGRLNNTTNDMTSNGRIVVDEYAQGTTVLQDGMDYSGVQNGYGMNGTRNGYNGGVMNDRRTGMQYEQMPEKKSAKALRVISYPLAAATIVLAIGLLFSAPMKEGIYLPHVKIAAIAMLCIGIIVIAAGRAKAAIGICMIAASFAYILEAIAGFVSAGVSAFPIFPAILAVCGLLILVGGISVTAQKEPKLGGSMLIYALAIEWIYYVYNMISSKSSFGAERWHIFFAVMALAVILWSIGFNSGKEETKAGRIIRLAAFAPAAAAVIFTIILVVKELKFIL